MSQLIKSSLQPSSRPIYKRSWSLFYQFFHTTFPGVTVRLPVSVPHLALFIAFLFDRNYAASTVNTYISAISYSHKLLSHPDLTKAYFIVQMLRGFSKLGSRVDARLPITLPILHRILAISHELSLSVYELCLFQAMCSLGFHAFLRVGEMAITNNNDTSVLTIDNITKLVNANNHVVSLKVTFLNYKHSYNQRPFSIIITRQSSFCPVEIILDYLTRRANLHGPLFIMDGAPVSRTYFCNILSRAIQRCGLSPARYKGHSFRIGAATHAAEKGMSDAQIRVLGRWKSSAFLRYIRMSSISTA